MYFLLWLNSKLVSGKIKPPCLNSKSENPLKADKWIINIIQGATMNILDIFKNNKRKVEDNNIHSNITYIDSNAYERKNINLSEIEPIRTFDNMPQELSSMAYKNFSSWQNYAASIGINNSLAQYSSHVLNRLSYQECANLATDSMISKAIDVITREIFKSGGKWIDTHLDIDNFEMILNSLDFYNKITLAVQRALEYGGAFIYINTDDTDLSLPLYINEKTAKNNKITGLTVIEPWQVAPIKVNSFNPLRENYMQPDLWWVLGAGGAVHKSRLIPIIFYSVPDLIKPLYNYLGLPLSFYMKNYVSNADTVRQSISDLVLRFRTKIIKTTAQKIADPQTQARVKYMNATSNNLATLLLAKDEEWIETVTSLSGMDNLLSQMYELMTASTRGIPVTKLLGLSPRGFNATGEYDENNFYDVIDGYAKSVVVPLMEKVAEYILCFKIGVLRQPKYEFKPRKQVTQKEQAEINNLKADYISKLIMSGVVTGKDAIKAINEDNFKFDWIDIEDYKIPENPEVEKDIFNQWMDSWKESEHDRDENGRFKGNGGSKSESNNDDIQVKIDSLKKIDFSKDNKLPNLNKDTLKQYGFEDKPVLLKKNIIEKNKVNHPDITDDMAREIIGNSLYKPEAILKANKDKPAYHNFITRLKDDKNSIVLLELSDEKENYEIVNYHYLDDYGVRKKEKIDKNIKK